MDIFIRNLSKHTTKEGAQKFFRPKLKAFGIDVFEFERLRNRAIARITILDIEKGERFIAAYPQGTKELCLDGHNIQCSRSKHDADKWKLRVLEKDAIDLKKSRPKVDAAVEKLDSEETRTFRGLSLECGTWDYIKDDPVFVSQFIDTRPVTIELARGLLVIVIPMADGRKICLQMPYSTVLSIIFRNPTTQSDLTAVAITLDRAPKMYGIPAPPSEIQVNNFLFSTARLPKEPNLRLSSLGFYHDIIAGHCFVYQIRVESVELRYLKLLVSRKSYLPPQISMVYNFQGAPTTFATDLDRLRKLFRESYTSLKFEIKFQAQRLAQNGYLSPMLVAKLLPTIIAISDRSGYKVAVRSIHKLFSQIPFAGPDIDAHEFDLDYLSNALVANEESTLNDPTSVFGLVSRHSHLVLIHQVRITPAGMYLEGPHPEPKNRILRDYHSHSSTSFIRVTFEDEDGGSIRYDRHGSLDHIHDRFKEVLKTQLDIGGQSFEFLGFSHSSLRDQTCWMMSPFLDRGKKMLSSRSLIARLGNFSQIHVPAKCAARIGQAFTDLNDSVPIPQESILEVEDIVSSEGRVFSDGCSPASLAIFERIWKSSRDLKFQPTLYQIRLGGASNHSLENTGSIEIY